MSYLDKHLQPGENILIRTRRSAIILVDTIFFAILALVFLVGFYYFGWLGDLSNLLRACIAFAPLLVCLLLLLLDIISFIELELIVTNKRVLGKKGFKALSVIEIPLGQITNTEVGQSIFGRVFDYGMITISTASGQFDYEKIRKPLEIQRTINQARLG